MCVMYFVQQYIGAASGMLVEGQQEIVNFSSKATSKWVLPTSSNYEKESGAPAENCSPGQHFDISLVISWTENPALQWLDFSPIETSREQICVAVMFGAICYVA